MNERYPNVWCQAKLSDLVQIIRGVTYKKNQSSGLPIEGSIPVLRATNIQNDSLHLDDLVFIESSLVKDIQKIRKNDVVVAMSSGSKSVVGKIAQSKEDIDAGFGAFCCLLRPSEMIQPELIGFYTRSAYYRSRVSELSAGANINNLKPVHFDELSFPIPPLAEQKVIADKLDSLLAQVETTKERLDRIPDILKRFRQSVSAAAVSGRLTEEWRELNNIKGYSFAEIDAEKQKLIELKSVKKDLFAQQAEPIFDVPKSWLFLRLKSLAIKITDGEHKTPKRESSGRYLLSARNVRDGYISTENVDYVGEEEFTKLRKRCDPNKGDVLISCSGSVGRISLVDQDDTYVMVRSAAFVRVVNEYIDNKFLMYVLQSPMLQKNIEESSKSTAQSNLFLGPIKELSVPLPSCGEQTEIVRRVEELFAFADAVEQKAQAASERVNKLTQSILAKAFRGELTADWRAANPDLISGENSAEALLEKIKSEREALKPKKKTRAKKVKKV